jgi:putative ATPase
MADIEVLGARVIVVAGDITTLAVDAIVNAANAHLAHGGGVAAAIARAGAPQVERESRVWVAENGPLGRGQAAVTGAGDMPAEHVIHVVGPVYRDGQDNERLLREAVSAAMHAAAQEGDRSMAIPAISAGIFGYPLDEATRVIADAVLVWLRLHPGVLEEVRLVGYDTAAADAFRRALED